MSGKKFRFSLQNVLDLRHYETNQIEQALQSAVAARQEQERCVQEARERLNALTADAPNERQTNLHKLRQFDAFRQNAQYALSESKARLKELREKEERIRAEWMECRQAQESLQSLHDKEQEQHRKNQSEAELAFIDEQSVMRYCRSNRTSLL